MYCLSVLHLYKITVYINCTANQFLVSKIEAEIAHIVYSKVLEDMVF